MYYVEIEVQVEYSMYKYSYKLYFKDKECMDKWLQWYNNWDEKSSLNNVVDFGIAKFNSSGILDKKTSLMV